MLPLTRSRNRARFFGIPFSPLSLFAAGEQGTWYDPSDFSTLFQDSAGTTPVTGVEQVVGLMLDKSGNANNATSTGAARPTLSARVNLLLATTTLATQNVTTVATTHTLSFAGTGSITLSGTATGTFSAGTHSVVCTAGTLTLTVTGTVTNADLRVSNDGVGIPAYQRVNTATDYDTSGFPLYLRFGGTQAMSTGSIDFTATDKMTVWAGVTSLSLAVTSIIAELSVAFNSNAGTFVVYTENDRTIRFGRSGSVPGLNTANSTARTAPLSYVYAAAADLAGTTGPTEIPVFKINGTNATNAYSGSGDTGGGNFGAYPLFIGARNNGVSFPMTARLYSLITRGAQSTAAEISATESWVNSRTGAYT